MVLWQCHNILVPSKASNYRYTILTLLPATNLCCFHVTQWEIHSCFLLFCLFVIWSCTVCFFMNTRLWTWSSSGKSNLVSQIFFGLLSFQLISVHIGHQDVYILTEITLRLINFRGARVTKNISLKAKKDLWKGAKMCFGRCVCGYLVTAQVDIHSTLPLSFFS